MAQDFLEPPAYGLHDVYRDLSILAKESDLIQADCCKNSSFLYNRDSRILYYDCSNFYFEIEQEDGKKKYGKSKEHRSNPIVQMGLFMDRDGEEADIKYYLDEDKIANEEIQKISKRR